MHLVRVITAAIAVTVLFGCTSDADSGPPAAIIVATEAPEGEPTPTPEVIGDPIGALYQLATGDCFNEYGGVRDETGVRRDLTTVVDCDIAHDAEVYLELSHPAGAGVPYPGAVELNRWGMSSCYDAFTEFVGIDYELSELEIGVIIPEEPNWVAGPYRTVECYLYSVEGQLSGSMRGSRL